MKAAVVERYGPASNTRVTDVAEPRRRAGDLLVEVHAAAVTSGDARIRGGSFPKGMNALARLGLGFRGPRRRVLGIVLSGVVLESGDDGFAVGDRVAGMAGAGFGAHAERVAIEPKRVVRVPDSVSHEAAAAAIFGGSTALYFLRDLGRLQPGSTVLVNGASGAVGTSAVQFARSAGANVTGVTSAGNAELVRQLGADTVIDYRQQSVAEITDRFDIVIDMVGNVTPALGRRLVTAQGVAILGVAGLGEMLQARGQVKAGSAKELPSYFSVALEALADGTLDPVVQQSFPLKQIADAYAIVDSGRKVGNVVVLPQE